MKSRYPDRIWLRFPHDPPVQPVRMSRPERAAWALAAGLASAFWWRRRTFKRRKKEQSW